MNVYEKLQKIKLELLNADLKKTGENKFAKFKYYQLSDFIPCLVKFCFEQKCCTIFNFEKEKATLKFIDCEAENSSIEVSSPLERLEIKGANAIQILGGIQTYIRRYLYMAMFDINENDTFDELSGKKESPTTAALSLKKENPNMDVLSDKNDDIKYLCFDCKAEFKPFTSKENKYYTAKQVYQIAESKSLDKKARCKNCREKLNTEVAKNA